MSGQGLRSDQTLPNQLGEQYGSEYFIPTWAFIIAPSVFNFGPLCVLVISYCMIWVKIKRSNHLIQGMVAFNKHRNEVCTRYVNGFDFFIFVHMYINILFPSHFFVFLGSIFPNDWPDFWKLLVLLNISNNGGCIWVS